MVINQQDKFKTEFKKILEYIAKDNVFAAKSFKNELIRNIKLIPDNPYKYRPSKYICDEKVRDMIFKGYTIVYRVRTSEIEIITIFNQNLPVLDEDEESDIV